MSAPPKKMGMSLYADLLGNKPEGGATISGAPVKYDSKKDEADGEGQKKKDGTVT